MKKAIKTSALILIPLYLIIASSLHAQTTDEDQCYYVVHARTGTINGQRYEYFSPVFKAKCDEYSVGVCNQFNDEMRTINAEHASSSTVSGVCSSFEFKEYSEAAKHRRELIGDAKNKRRIVHEINFAYHQD